MSKITTDILLEKARAKELGKFKVTTVHVASLGGELEFRKIPSKKVVSMLEGLTSDDPQIAMDSQIQLVYECCPVLQSRELHQELGCVEPTDVVMKVLDDNVGELLKISETILNLYGFSNNEVNLKN